jgi:hypothetical protein
MSKTLKLWAVQEYPIGHIDFYSNKPQQTHVRRVYEGDYIGSINTSCLTAKDAIKFRHELKEPHEVELKIIDDEQ